MLIVLNKKFGDGYFVPILNWNIHATAKHTT